VADELRRIAIYKPGAQVFSDEHGKTTIFRFADNPSLTVKHAYQVKRADFDKLLLDNSRRCGATVQEEVRVTDIALMPGARAKVTGLDPDGTIGVWLPRFVVDATGRDTLLANRFKTKGVDKRNKMAALFGHFRDVERRDGNAEGMIAAPAIVKAAVEGRLPRGFGLKRLVDLRMAWPDQWRALGLQAPAQA
jgi:flavin-dependent dehydrogenase